MAGSRTTCLTREELEEIRRGIYAKIFHEIQKRSPNLDYKIIKERAAEGTEIVIKLLKASSREYGDYIFIDHDCLKELLDELIGKMERKEIEDYEEIKDRLDEIIKKKGSLEETLEAIASEEIVPSGHPFLEALRKTRDMGINLLVGGKASEFMSLVKHVIEHNIQILKSYNFRIYNLLLLSKLELKEVNRRFTFGEKDDEKTRIVYESPRQRVLLLLDDEFCPSWAQAWPFSEIFKSHTFSVSTFINGVANELAPLQKRKNIRITGALIPSLIRNSHYLLPILFAFLFSNFSNIFSTNVDIYGSLSGLQDWQVPVYNKIDLILTLYVAQRSHLGNRFQINLFPPNITHDLAMSLACHQMVLNMLEKAGLLDYTSSQEAYQIGLYFPDDIRRRANIEGALISFINVQFLHSIMMGDFASHCRDAFERILQAFNKSIEKEDIIFISQDVILPPINEINYDQLGDLLYDCLIAEINERYRSDGYRVRIITIPLKNFTPLITIRVGVMSHALIKVLIRQSDLSHNDIIEYVDNHVIRNLEQLINRFRRPELEQLKDLLGQFKSELEVIGEW